MYVAMYLRVARLYINVRARKGWNFEKVMRILRLDLEIRRELPYLCSRKSGGRAMNDRVWIEGGNEKVSLKIWWSENFALPLHSQKKRTALR